MTNTMLIIILIILLIIFTTLIFQHTAKYVYSYKINNIGIVVVLFGIMPLMRIKFSNIKEIKNITFKETMTTKDTEMFFALRFGNRILGDIVLVRKKKGIVKAVMITPDNAEKFIQEVKIAIPGGEKGALR